MSKRTSQQKIHDAKKLTERRNKARDAGYVTLTMWMEETKRDAAKAMLTANFGARTSPPITKKAKADDTVAIAEGVLDGSKEEAASGQLDKVTPIFGNLDGCEIGESKTVGVSAVAVSGQGELDLGNTERKEPAAEKSTVKKKRRPKVMMGQVDLLGEITSEEGAA